MFGILTGSKGSNNSFGSSKLKLTILALLAAGMLSQESCTSGDKESNKSPKDSSIVNIDPEVLRKTGTELDTRDMSQTIRVFDHGITKKYKSSATELSRVYLGLELTGEETVGDTININMAHGLEYLWKLKLSKRRTGKAHNLKSLTFQQNWKALQSAKPDQHMRLTNPVSYYYLTQIKPYIDGEKDVQPETIQHYVADIQGQIDEVNDNINWRTGGSVNLMNLFDITDTNRFALFEDLIRSIDGLDIASYSLTEMMEESEDGRLNIELLDHMLKHGGKQFVQNIPALGDDMTSFGPYQFTTYAFYGVMGAERGSSYTNLALPSQYKIPGSLVDMKREDHHKAAYLFMIYNIGQLIKSLNTTQFTALQKSFSQDKEHVEHTLIQYFAMAHNAPAHANKSVKAWIDHGCKGDIYTYGRTSIQKQYGKKTAVNLPALHAFWGDDPTINSKYIAATDTSDYNHYGVIKEKKTDIVQVFKNKDFVFERKTTDGNFVVYSYVLKKGGTPGAVKGKFIDQIPDAKTREIFVTDSKGSVLAKKDKIPANTKVYIKVSN